MQYKKSLVTVTLASTAMAAYHPGEPWNTLTPTGTYSGGITNYASTFGIAVEPIATASASASASITSSASSSIKKRDVISQIGDGQIQATTKTTTTLSPKKTTAAAISQIGDGQIQATTTTSTAKKTTAAAISQIGDGQIQATTKTATKKTTAAAVSQIGDGQIQATTSSKSTASSASPAATGSASDPVTAESCKNSGTLQLSLKDGVLTDIKGRIGSIVANRQFQFDGPPPQAGAIYAGGWSITPEGNLALGNDDVFYQCLSGDFYNLYDEKIGGQCHPIHLQAIDLIAC